MDNSKSPSPDAFPPGPIVSRCFKGRENKCYERKSSQQQELQREKINKNRKRNCCGIKAERGPSEGRAPRDFEKNCSLRNVSGEPFTASGISRDIRVTRVNFQEQSAISVQTRRLGKSFSDLRKDSSGERKFPAIGRRHRINSFLSTHIIFILS